MVLAQARSFHAPHQVDLLKGLDEKSAELGVKSAELGVKSAELETKLEVLESNFASSSNPTFFSRRLPTENAC